MSTNSFTVVVAFDFTDMGKQALFTGLDLAAGQEGGVVHVVHVAEGYGPMLRLDLGDETKTADPAQAESFLKERVRQLVAQHTGQADGANVEVRLRVGSASEEIAQHAAKVDADLVIVGTHGRRGVSWLLLGSVAQSVTRKAGCSVLVVRPKNHFEVNSG